MTAAPIQEVDRAHHRPLPVLAVLAVAATAALATTPDAVGAQAATLTAREAAERLTHVPLVFEQPQVAKHDVGGVQVILLEDRDLPLVTVAAYVRGGYGLFGREYYGAGMGLPAVLRYGGTERLTPEQVDEEVESYAFQLAFGTSGGSVTASINTLTEHLSTAVRFWGELLTRPRFDVQEIEAWRSRQLEGVLRRVDDPARLAYSELNRLLFGDHPVGWETDAADLAPERLRPEVFQALHERIVCRENMILGVTGDTDWASIEPLLAELVERVPQCAEELPEGPAPVIRRAPGVFLIEKDLAQSVVVMAHPTTVQLGEQPEFFAAMIGNSILGGGGFSSRMMGRVRTEEGYAYSATSLWTTPREHEGIVGATTRTRPENTAPAIELILSTMRELREAAPSDEEVDVTVDQVVNGFVFNFDSPARIVSRTMYYLAQDLPEDWLERYLRGVQQVTPEQVRAVFAEHLRPDEMTILVVGDPALIAADLAALGPIQVLEVR
jgi:predicted Zn-dependent peptidase